MDPFTIGAIGAPVLGGILGDIFSSGDSEEARKQREKALALWLNLKKPSIEEQRVVYGKLKSVGHLTPELEQTFQQGTSEMKNVSVDPRLRQVQMDALLKLQGISNENGLDIQDRAKLEQIRSQVAQQEKGSRDAIMQNMAARGMSGSGMELAQQLQAQQGASNRASADAFSVGADARARALQALMQSGTLAGSMRSQDFGEQAQVAQAQDAINRFNTQNKQQVSGANIDRANQAKQHNLTNDQRIADQNVAISNQQEEHNKGLYQQNFNNDVAIARGASGQYDEMAGNSMAEADRKRKMWSGIGQGVGQGATAAHIYKK